MDPVRAHVAVLSIAGTDVAMENVVADALTRAGHQITSFESVRDTEIAIRSHLVGWVEDPDIDLVLVVGEGKLTSKAMAPLVEQPLPGFADLLRMLAYQEIGASAMLSTAEAAKCGSTFVFVLPASVEAVRAAMEKLILPQLDPTTTPKNLIGEMPRFKEEGEFTYVDNAKAPADSIPVAIPKEKTGAGVGVFPRLPAATMQRSKSRTGQNVLIRNIDDPTKPIELQKLEQQIELSKTSEEETKAVDTQPDLSRLPAIPPGADQTVERDLSEETLPAGAAPVGKPAVNTIARIAPSKRPTPTPVVPAVPAVPAVPKVVPARATPATATPVVVLPASRRATPPAGVATTPAAKPLPPMPTPISGVPRSLPLPPPPTIPAPVLDAPAKPSARAATPNAIVTASTVVGPAPAPAQAPKPPVRATPPVASPVVPKPGMVSLADLESEEEHEELEPDHVTVEDAPPPKPPAAAPPTPAAVAPPAPVPPAPPSSPAPALAVPAMNAPAVAAVPEPPRNVLPPVTPDEPPPRRERTRTAPETERVSSLPPPPRSSSDLPEGRFSYPNLRPRSRLPLVLVLLLFFGGAGAAGWYFFLRDPGVEPKRDKPVDQIAQTPVTPDAVEIDATIEIEIEPDPPKTEPNKPDPRKVDPRKVEPRKVDPRRNDPRKTAPKPEPRTEPKTEPKTAPKTEPKPEPKTEPKTDPKTEPPPAEGCDEVTCVLEKYAKPCCAKYKPTTPDKFQPAGPNENLDRTQIKAGIDRVRGGVIACGDKHKVAGTVKVMVAVDGDGLVTNVSVAEAPDPGLGSCVAGVVKRARFAKTTNGGSFTIPFVF